VGRIVLLKLVACPFVEGQLRSQPFALFFVKRSATEVSELLRTALGEIPSTVQSCILLPRTKCALIAETRDVGNLIPGLVRLKKGKFTYVWTQQIASSCAWDDVKLCELILRILVP